MERRTFRFFTKRSEHYNNLQKQEEEEKLNGIVNNNNQSSPIKDIPQSVDAGQKSVNGKGAEDVEEAPKSGVAEESGASGGGGERSSAEQKQTPTKEVQPPSQEGSEVKKVRQKQPKSEHTPSSQHSKTALANGKRHGSPSGSGGSTFMRIAPAPASTPTHSTSGQHTPLQSTAGKSVPSQVNSERPLKCLETLAQKAGITFDEKYEVANTLIKLEKSQSPAQQPVAAQQPQPVPLALSQEQFQQLHQQLQLHSAFAGNAIQVKQEFPHQATAQPTMQMSTEIKQQIVDVANQQHQQQAQVQQMQVIDSAQATHQQNPPSSGAANAMGPPQTSTTISTMSPLHAMPANQVPAEWQHGRVQVLQQPIQNPAYLQQLYSPQVLMPGNILHSGLGQQQIQVIAAGKPFQSAPQMLATTAQGKPVIGSSAGGFSGTYALPTIPSSQAQALLFSPVSVLSSQPQQQQQNLLSTMQAPQAGKPLSEQDMQKALAGQKVLQKVAASSAAVQNIVASAATPAPQGATTAGAAPGQQCVQVSQAMPTQIISPLQQPSTQQMQFAPWLAQGVQQFWTTNGLQSQALLTQNPIIFRGAAQPDGSQSMFAVQPNPQAAAPQVIQAQPQNPTITLPCNMQPSVVNKQPQRVATETIAPKQPARAAPILPQGGGGGGGAQQIRPASSVSTQTQQNQVVLKPGKLRAKPHTVRPSAPGTIKGDAMIQAKIVGGQVTHSVAQSMPQQTMHQVMTSAGSKMVVMSTNPGTPINIGATQLAQMTTAQPAQQIQIATDKQSMQMQQQVHQQKPPIQAQRTASQVFQPQVVQHIQQLQQQMHPQPTAISQQAFLQTQQQQQQAVQNQLLQQQQQQIVIQQQGGAQPPQVLTVTAAGQQPATIQPKPSTMVIGTSQHQIVADRGAVSTVAAITSTSNPVQVVPSSAILNQVNTQLGTLAASANLIGPLTSPQAPLQPPPNPLVAMTTLSAAPLSAIAVGNPPVSKDIAVTTSEAPKTADASSGGNKQTETPATVTTSATGATGVSETSASVTISTVTVTSTGATHTQETLSNGKPSATAESPKKAAKVDAASGPTKPGDSPMKDVAKTNGTMATVEAAEANGETKSEKAVLKATVKPQVLTHVIEGFVIQEANEPFAVTRQRYPERDATEEPPKKKEKGSPPMSPLSSAEMACEYCGKTELKSKMKKKRFCSMSCAKASKDAGANPQAVESAKGASSGVPVNGTDAMEVQEDGTGDQAEEVPVMVRWTVQEVCDFIKNLPGCSELAEDFAHQEIDGQALLLLKENHLVNAMGIKLGPALKIVAKVEALRLGTANGEKEGQTQ
ncbi:polyhomeotic-proximal chromatin protein-like isoform X2 [Phlebotomus argentipes]|uniref:polyhomeotic-proximal chromatin protein-like isoform X2 n=1 Tax=Phlebotomus argentipes TaxID=94469 RepID=UPI002893221E|nr:polyhomeotic-proximal chromatin protein-like isoform X2 [Phlebotomus argentipes]